MPIYTLVDGEEVRAQGLRWSNTDPGGFDAASFTTERVPEPGAPVRVLDGLGELFGGHVEEPGRRQERGRESANVQAVGHADLLKRNPYSMVYIDRDLRSWGASSTARQLSLVTSTFHSVGSQEVLVGVASGSALKLAIQAPWDANTMIEAVYDAGSENRIAGVRGSWARIEGVTPSDANFFITLEIATGDTLATVNSLSVRTSEGVDVSHAPAGAWRVAAVILGYSVGFAGSNLPASLAWSNLRVIGDHGLPIMGGTAASEGVSPSDVITHALAMSGAGFEARIQRNPFVLPHLVYPDLIAPLQVATDIGKITAWHWGVWEPSSCLSDTPTLLYQPPPPAATAAVRYADCISPEIVEKLSDLHDEIILKWGDPAGGGGIERLESPHPRPRRPIRGLPLELDGGTLATQAVARQLAAMYLSIDQLQSRASGQATLPGYLLDGRPSHHLKSGRDRLELVGLPTRASLIADPPARPGAFRVKRVEATVDDNSGVPATQVQFDAGADLIEALNARLGIASVLAGS